MEAETRRVVTALGDINVDLGFMLPHFPRENDDNPVTAVHWGGEDPGSIWRLRLAGWGRSLT